ncbi:MAG: hypothetical protein RLY86_2889 [Pseudomonadota bacterium]|jgi:3-deoxy-manno-octulosonate cytidylyltransferase (CMP-KDO synthetase)
MTDQPASPIIIIPARLGSTRLPDKPLADIGGVPMIVHVWRRAVAAGIGPVVVAAAEPAIARAVQAAGGQAVLTDPDHPSGSDRIWEAVRMLDPEGRHDAVVNVQGDLPTIAPETIRAVFAPLSRPGTDIATLVTEIREEGERTNPNVVKAILELPPGGREGRALYFTRATAPSGPGPLYHHIGLYAYRRDALARFVALPPAELEKRERLEQLRALAHGMTIRAAVVDAVPLGVDTQEDLARARALLAG